MEFTRRTIKPVADVGASLAAGYADKIVPQQTRKRYELNLEDIVSSCTKILQYTQGMTFEDFVADERTFDAVIFNLLVIRHRREKDVRANSRSPLPTLSGYAYLISTPMSIGEAVKR